MTRDLTASMDTALAATVLRPVLIARLDIRDDPLYAWTGPGAFVPVGSGDTALDGNTYLPAEGLVDIGTVAEEYSAGGPMRLTVTAAELNDVLMRQVVRDRRIWQGRKAWLWLGLLDTDDMTVIPWPVRLKTGVISSMEVTRGGRGGPVCTVTIDADLGRATGAAYRIKGHALVWPGDTASTYLVRLAQGPLGAAHRDGSRRGGGGRGSIDDRVGGVRLIRPF